VRRCAVDALRTSIIHIPNKEQARQDLISLAHEKDRGVRWRAADALRTSTSHIPNKKLAWQDLHRDRNLRLGAARALETAISHTPNDEQTWQDLHRLSQDVDSNVRWRAADALGTSAYS